MPRVHVTRSRLAESDLDAFHEARGSACARLLQQAATEASSDAGYPEAWYAREGTIWIIRRSTMEFRRPIGPGMLAISTWVADFRRVRSIRRYRIRHEAKDEPAVEAQTDWVYVDRSTGRPRTIPEEMTSAFVPGGRVPSLPRQPLAMPAVPAHALGLARRVETRDLDALEHVNNAAYLDYVEDAAWAALDHAGWPLDRLRREGGHFRFGRHDIEYLEEARSGETLTCLTWIAAIDGTSVERHTEIRRERAPLTRARSRWVWIERDAPAVIPAELVSALRLEVH